MTEQNNAHDGSNPRMWQGREIRNDMPVLPAHSEMRKQTEELMARVTKDSSFNTEPMETSDEYMDRTNRELREQAIAEEDGLTTEPEMSTVDKAILGLSGVMDSFREEMKKNLLDYLTPVRPTPATVQRNLAQSREIRELQAKRPVFVPEPHLTHRPFRAALAGFTPNKEK